MPDDAPAPTTPSKPPAAPATPALVQAIDHLAEICAIAIAGYLTAHGKISGELFLGFATIVLGVQTGIRNVAKARTSGVVGLAFLAVGAHTLARSAGLLGGVLAVIALAGCPPPRRDDACQPAATRCHALDAGGTFAETCLQGEGSAAHWVHLGDRSCEARGGVCCRTRSAVSSRTYFACTTPATCEPEPTTADAGSDE